MLQAIPKITEKIFSGENFSFEEFSLELFAFQYTYNPVYRQFATLLKVNAREVKDVVQIPFLPISFFKTHKVLVENAAPQKIFESSGTTGQVPSRHYVSDPRLYIKSLEACFSRFYGDINEWTVLALLPSYLERENSSLVFMADHLIRKSGSPDSGFYLHNIEALAEKLVQLKKQNRKVLLLGVTYALLDLAEKFPMDLHYITIMETGGMKGRREELSRDKVHALLKVSFNAAAIHSEYGMTELLSQSYSSGNGIFMSPPWLKVFKRDVYDPLLVSGEPGRGGLNVIDLANVYSCPFIATDDMVNLRNNDEFEVIGRLDAADIRGCNLMAEG